MKHAPGPWNVKNLRVQCVDHGKHYTVAMANNKQFTEEANAANARLIAAAPDLLKTLETLAAMYRDDIDSVGMWAKVRADIVTVKGEY